MWSAKISFDGSKNVAGAYIKKRGIRMLVFPLGWNYEEEGIIVNYSGVVFGDEKGKAGFFRDWRNDKKRGKVFRGFRLESEGVMRDLETNGDFFVGKVWEAPISGGVYNSNLVYTRPWMIEENGRQTITVNAFRKKFLEEFILNFEKFHKIKVHYIRKEKVSNVAFTLDAPDLTERQKWAMDLAVTNGYYDYPRKISIKGLAILSGISFATFHGHLRKAEKVMMPFWFGR